MNGFLNFGSWWLNLDHVISVEFRQQEHNELQSLAVFLTFVLAPPVSIV
jgi:hypothetical protein